MTPVDLPAAGYRYLPGVFQYSAGVAALPGHRIERVRFHRPLPLAEGFRRIKAWLPAAGRPLAAFCACELRSPAPFTEAGFRAFNEAYVGTLSGWGLLGPDGANPVARSNVCPQIGAPPEPAFHAFAFTVADGGAPGSCIVSGSGEVPEGRNNYRDHIVRRGETGPDALRQKAGYVLGEMEARLGALGFGWPDTTATQAYTVHDLHPFLADGIVARGAAAAGLTWHLCRPPIVDIEFEMDCRAVPLERIAAA
jgi:hypothetical protein